ncbi:MAG: AAA family ATPase [Candidatus Altiarchaeales archaeon]|nr:MAG: AAA family ATPase [Candidatus Altiarchaeales archaeon]RLI93810.1 MAG: AAA family ATPase [Candidatus Altiarchaeales archaeon]RLI95024.1 MAG: AAA family ATPase [Candidatus Altiarchaeales archaeon]
MRKNILLTGRPGIGKTTIIKRVLDRIDLSAGGFYTQEIREHGIRTGFKIITLDGNEGLLAHTELNTRFRVGRYFVNIDDIDEIAVQSILDSLDRDLIIIDEIGRMELFSEKFKEAVILALETKRVLGTIMRWSNIFTDSIKARDDTDVIDVNLENRDSLVDMIVDILH